MKVVLIQCQVEELEIFDEKVRKRICGGKVSSAQWLEIHKLWHQRGRKSNATMLLGILKVEKIELIIF